VKSKLQSSRARERQGSTALSDQKEEEEDKKEKFTLLLEMLF
jgi:hypothetical protein